MSVDEDATTVTLQARATTTSDKMPESGITVALSATTAGDTATEGSDYRRRNRSFSFGQGDFTRKDVGGGQFRFQATKEISVSITDDTVDEPDEDFTITLSYSNPSLSHLQGGPDTATVTIADNDHVPVTLGWEETQFTAEEPTSPGATTPVTLRAMAVTETDKRPENGFTFDFTIATANGTARQPDDYEQLSTTESIDRNNFSRTTVDGQFRWVASRNVTVEVKHDTIDEPLETFSVRLAFVGPSVPYLRRGDLTATVTTTDDIASLADLRATVNGNRSVVSPQDELSYNWSVSNSGPSASTNTVLTATLDPGVTFVSATPDGACRRSGRTVTCSLGTLEANETTDGTIVVEVVGTASADLEFTAVARSDQLDRTPANNDDSESTELFAPPEQVRNLSPVRSSAAFIELSWARPSDNGSPITRYELERKEAGESYALVTPEPSVAATTYRDSQVSAGTTYTYQLRAFNADGDGEWSNEATATARDAPPPPPPPPPRTGGGGGGGGAPQNRAPEFMEGDRTTRSVAENTPAGVNIGEPVAATDFNRDALTYSLRGLGSDLFDVDASSGQLLTKAPLDYETESSYIVFVWVQDNKNAIGRPDTERDTVIRIELTVTNEDEAGTVALSSSEPDVDIPITAALTDPDGGLDARRLVVGALCGPDRVDGHPRGGVGLLHAGRRRQGQLPAGDGLLHGRTRAAQERAGGDGRLRPVERRASVSRYGPRHRQGAERRAGAERGGEHGRGRSRGRSGCGHGRRGRRADLRARRRRRGLVRHRRRTRGRSGSAPPRRWTTRRTRTSTR